MAVIALRNIAKPTIPAAVKALYDRATNDMAAGISRKDTIAAYRELPLLVRNAANMVFVPTHYKGGKIYGTTPRPIKNLLMYSERFEQGMWVKINYSVQSNAITVNGRTMDKVSGTSYMNSEAIKLTANTTVTFSIYVKDAGGGNITIGLHNGGSDYSNGIHFNPATGVITGSYTSNNYIITVGSPTVENVGDGVYRISATVKVLITLSYYIFIQGVGTSGVYLHGAQVEEGSTATAYEATNVQENLLKYSEQFDNSVWTKLNATVTSNTSISPDGNTTADSLMETSSSGNHELYIAAISTTAGGSYTLSIYTKTLSAARYLNLSLSINASSAISVRFDPSTNTLSPTYTEGSAFASVSATAQIASNGCYRVSITFTTAASQLVSPQIALSNTMNAPSAGNYGVNSYAGDGASGIYIWGAQLNYGSTALPYYKTTYATYDGLTTPYADFTFSRAGNGTMIGSDGLIQYAPHNLLVRSEEFDSASWGKSNSSVTANATIAPDGTLTADAIYDNTSNSDHSIGQGYSAISGTTYTLSSYVKLGNGATYVKINLWGAAGWSGDLIFNLVTGTYVQGLQAGSSYTITPLTSGWYRISVTTTATSSGTLTSYISHTNSNTHYYTGDGTRVIYAWGAQLNVGSKLLDYVQTTSAALYAPRFQYNPVTLAYEGMLIEKASTNLLLRSEEFDNSSWRKNNSVSISANNITAPDGTLTADRLNFTVNTGSSIDQSFGSANATTYTFSCFVKKAAGSDYVSLGITDNVTYGRAAWFNVNTGVVGTDSGVVAKTIQDCGNGWYRCSVSVTAQSTTTYYVDLRFTRADNGSNTTSGDTGYAWGAQLETGSVATSYIPTLASTVTRAVDLCNLTSGLGMFTTHQEIGTMWASCIPNEITIGTLISMGGSTAPDSEYSVRVTQNHGYLTTMVAGPMTHSLTRNIVSKLSFAYNNNDFASVVNGTLTGTDTSGTMEGSTITAIQLGKHYAASADYYTGIIKAIALFNTRRTNAELQTMTT